MVKSGNKFMYKVLKEKVYIRNFRTELHKLTSVLDWRPSPVGMLLSLGKAFFDLLTLSVGCNVIKQYSYAVRNIRAQLFKTNDVVT